MWGLKDDESTYERAREALGKMYDCPGKREVHTVVLINRLRKSVGSIEKLELDLQRLMCPVHREQRWNSTAEEQGQEASYAALDDLELQGVERSNPKHCRMVRVSVKKPPSRCRRYESDITSANDRFG